mmetsp:Transcript_16479/g.64296  ORF Transcript_16479/g.64296 Transcript_16479/m.64296 type:complete len:1268 (+) Transcript_16479:614-4417(+)
MNLEILSSTRRASTSRRNCWPWSKPRPAPGRGSTSFLGRSTGASSYRTTLLRLSCSGKCCAEDSASDTSIGGTSLQRINISVVGHEDARRDLHGHQLLEEELAGVGDVDLRDVRVVVAALALELLLLEVGDGEEATVVADVDAVGVGLREEALLEELRGAVGDDAIALHLSEAEAAVARPALHGLAREVLQGAARARVDLVVHHVLEALIVGGPDEEVRLQLPAGVAVVEHFVAVALVAAVVEHHRDLVGREGRVEGGGVALFAGVGRQLAEEAFNQLTDGHTRGNGVRVDDEVRRDALHREGHVVLAVGDADRSLLAVARRELVSDLRRAHRAHAHVDQLVAVLGRRDHHLVHDAVLAAPQGHRGVLLGVARSLRLEVVAAVRRDGGGLADDDVVARHLYARRDEAVLLELGVGAVQDRRLRVGHLVRLDRLACALQLVPVGAHEDGAEEAAVDGRLVHDDRILLVVARVAGDCHDAVLSCRQAAELEELHRARDNQRLLRVPEDVRHRVHAQLEVGDVHAHSLLAHSRLVGIARTLVVVGEGNDRAADAEDHRGVDLAVRERRVRGAEAGVLEVTHAHADHHRLLLLAVDELDAAVVDQRLPAEAAILEVAGARLVLQPLDVTLLHHQVLVVHNEQRPAAAAGVRVQPQLLVADVVHDRHLPVESVVAAQGAQTTGQLVGVVRDTHPGAVDEDLGCAWDVLRVHAVEHRDALFVQELHHRPGRGADCDVAHERQVLHKPARLALGRLGRADEAPVRVVQLARLRQLSLAADGRVQAAQMGERRGEREPDQHLRDARACGARLAVCRPVAGSEGVLEAVCDSVRLEGQLEVDVAAVVHLALDEVARLLGQLAEELAEEVGQQRAGQVEALVGVVVAVVRRPPLQAGQEQAVHDVSEEEHLARDRVLVDAHVRQHLLEQLVHGHAHTPLLRQLLSLWQTGANEVQRQLLLLDHLCLAEARPHQLHHRSVREVVHNVLEDVLVCHVVERAEDEDDRHLLADVGHLRLDSSATRAALALEHLHVHGGRRLAACLRARADLRDVRVLGGSLLLEHVHTVRAHLLLGYQHLLGAVDDEVAALVVGALSVLRELVVRRVAQSAVLRPHHDGDLSDEHLLVNLCGGSVELVALHIQLLRLFVHVYVEGRSIGHVAEARPHGVKLAHVRVCLCEKSTANRKLSKANSLPHPLLLLSRLARELGRQDERVCLVDDLLHLRHDELLEGVELLAHESHAIEVRTNHMPALVLVDLHVILVVGLLHVRSHPDRSLTRE